MGPDFYRELLKRYMAHVLDCEGYSYVHAHNYINPLSTADVTELTALEEEIAAEAAQKQKDAPTLTFNTPPAWTFYKGNPAKELGLNLFVQKQQLGVVDSFDFETADAQHFQPLPPIVNAPSTPNLGLSIGMKGFDHQDGVEPQDFADLLAQTFATDPSNDEDDEYDYDGDDKYFDEDAAEVAPDPLQTLPEGAPHPEMSWLEKHVTGTGQLMWVHERTHCNNPEQCSIHCPTDPRQDWPTKWDGYIGRMMRVCPHGVAHPDKDHLAFIQNTWYAGSGSAKYEKHHKHHCCTYCAAECKAAIG